MKEIVFYKNGHYLTLQKCTDRRKRPIQKTFREEAERQTEKEKASNLIDIIFLKSQNQFDISIFNFFIISNISLYASIFPAYRALEYLSLFSAALRYILSL